MASSALVASVVAVQVRLHVDIVASHISELDELGSVSSALLPAFVLREGRIKLLCVYL